MIKYTDFNEEQTRKASVFVGNNFEKFNKRWSSMSNRNSKTSWNWVAFFFAPFWFGYRKMHLFAISYIIFDAIMTTLSSINEYNFGVYIVIQLITLAVTIAIPIYANYLYLVRANETINSTKTDKELETKGGTNGGFVVLYLLVLILSNVTIELTFSTTSNC